MFTISKLFKGLALIVLCVMLMSFVSRSIGVSASDFSYGSGGSSNSSGTEDPVPFGGSVYYSAQNALGTNVQTGDGAINGFVGSAYCYVDGINHSSIVFDMDTDRTEDYAAYLNLSYNQDSGVNPHNYGYITVDFDISACKYNDADYDTLSCNFSLYGSYLSISRNYSLVRSDSNSKLFDLANFTTKEVYSSDRQYSRFVYVIRCNNEDMAKSSIATFVDGELVDVSTVNLSYITHISSVNITTSVESALRAISFCNVNVNVFDKGYEGAISELFDACENGEDVDLYKCTDIKRSCG